MNKKRWISAMLIVTLTCGLGLTACGGTQGSVPGTEEAEVQRYAWPLGSSSPEDTVTQIYAEKFAEEVDRLSGGSMKISVYPNSVLGGDRELLESCKDGDIPFVVQNTAPQVTFMKDTAVFDMPALFETIDEVREHVDNLEFMELMQQVYHDGGYELLGYADQGFRVMTTNKKVESLADFKGQKIRTMENQVQLDSFTAFGASPLPMAYGELYTALQQNIIDGAEAANTNYYSKKFYEAAPHWAMVGWTNDLGICVVAKNFYDSLSDEHKQIIDECTKEMIDKERELYTASEDECLELLKGEGIEITEPDREPFIEAAQSVYDQWGDKVGGRDKIDAIVNFGK